MGAGSVNVGGNLWGGYQAGAASRDRNNKQNPNQNQNQNPLANMLGFQPLGMFNIGDPMNMGFGNEQNYMGINQNQPSWNNFASMYYGGR